jgi:hypothetical protein
MDISRTSPADVSQRAEVEPVILDCANSSVDRCSRAVNVSHWGDPDTPFDRGTHSCCNKHDPSVDMAHLEDVQRRAEASKAKAREKKKEKGGALRSDRTHMPPDEAEMQPIARQIIYDWRRLNLPRMGRYEPHMPYSMILSDSLVELLARKLHVCTSLDRFCEVMASWSHLNEWGESLFALVNEIWSTFESATIEEMLKDEQERKKRDKRRVGLDGEVDVANGLPPSNHVLTTQTSAPSSSAVSKAKSRVASRRTNAGQRGLNSSKQRG